MAAVLVTGGGGLVGHATARQLLAEGRAVVCYDRRAPGDARLAGATYVVGDLADYPRLFGAIRANEVDLIAHTGAASGPMVEADNPFAVCQANIGGTLNVFEAARLFGVRRVVHCSSGSAYGSSDREVVDETTPFRPTTVYGVTKATGDMLGAVYRERHGLDVLSVRLGFVYGPRRATDCFLRDAILDALAGRAATLPGGPDRQIQHLYVDDAARALILALDAARPPLPAYNIPGGPPRTVAECAAILRELIPGADIEIAPSADPWSERRGPLDGRAAARDLGYQPSVTLEQGIAMYVDWLRAERAGA